MSSLICCCWVMVENSNAYPYLGPVFLFLQACRRMTVISLCLLTVGSWDQWAIWAVGEIVLFPGCSCCCSVAKLCPTLCDPMDCSTPGSSVLHYLSELLKLMTTDLVMPSNHLILCHPLLLSSVFPSIRVFSNQLALLIKWPEYWNFSFSISLSNEYSALISFRIDWFDLLAAQGALKTLL